MAQLHHAARAINPQAVHSTSVAGKSTTEIRRNRRQTPAVSRPIRRRRNRQAVPLLPNETTLSAAAFARCYTMASTNLGVRKHRACERDARRYGSSPQTAGPTTLRSYGCGALSRTRNDSETIAPHNHSTTCRSGFSLRTHVCAVVRILSQTDMPMVNRSSEHGPRDAEANHVCAQAPAHIMRIRGTGGDGHHRNFWRRYGARMLHGAKGA